MSDHDLGTQGDLLAFVSRTQGSRSVRIEKSFGDGYVKLCTTEAERRQAKQDVRSVEDVVIELLRNARDAGASTIYLSSSKNDANRFITVIDDGCGIPEHMQEAVFDARVTSKLESSHIDRWGMHGRGMALFSIKLNVPNARIVASGPGLGTSLALCIDTNLLPEKADQSTWPSIGKNDEGTRDVCKGPHNILRTALEFAFEERRTTTLFIGSPSEILSTLVWRPSRRIDSRSLIFCKDPAALPVYMRPQLANDACELASLAKSIGLDVSARTAQRVLTKEIPPLDPSIDAILLSEASPRPVDISKDARSLKIQPDDLADFSAAVVDAFSILSQRYYLNVTGSPTVRLSGDSISVSIQFAKDS